MKHEHLLKSHQLKATPQRLAIIQLMHQAGHISIDELYQKIREKFSSISLATLYKNVNTMLDVTLIREIKIAGQKTKYEIEKEAHAHIMCKSCGELKDIEYDPHSILQKSIEMSHYKAEDISIVISGVCPECQKK
ncbi:MAG: transcriptional repressor [Sulfuricurvum sp. GWF2_44_89]|uniref:Transcriptional repressor n=1 Tax=Sulfuricurvum kujiense TaxID=148813 RepID=A0A2D3WFZ0_9BACT|nr:MULTISPECIES: Fur family transcriptional regulator [Sulfuricurvum]OHD78794.1 MAG: transcriptional repressor [Sulfuricurvum sp. GWF2_44_89]OHD92365.1 MAG: transcriptional repressor [Sulfuricurvum sp. RIFOXYD2_FULL_44_160]OHD95720.1 MAG: transcriptional repressor [Sulfuricurvum sp. RIFOXYD12_FULL_44_77]DAB37657.1 MAG TPA: transcriptional repressor [Sulfuricurvum kujiense]